MGNAGEMGHRVARQGLKDNIVLTLPLDLSAGGNASRISEQYDLQKDGRVIGGATALVILIIFIESVQIDMVIDEPVKGKFKGTGLDLLLKIDNNHRVLVVVILFKVWHGFAS